MFINTDNLVNPEVEFSIGDNNYTLTGTLKNLKEVTRVTNTDINILVESMFDVNEIDFFKLSNIFSALAGVNHDDFEQYLYDNRGMNAVYDLRFLLQEFLMISIAKPCEKKRGEILEKYNKWIEDKVGKTTMEFKDSLGKSTDDSV